MLSKFNLEPLLQQIRALTPAGGDTALVCVVNDGAQDLETVEEWLQKYGDSPTRGNVIWSRSKKPGLVLDSSLALTTWEALLSLPMPSQRVQTEKVGLRIFETTCSLIDPTRSIFFQLPTGVALLG